MARGGIKIERTDSEYETAERGPYWLDNFVNRLANNEQKTAVEVARQRNDEPTIFERMNAIMNGGGRLSPYASVEEAVTDYQKRTGLIEYHKIAMAQEIIASAEEEEQEEMPELLKKNPAIETYIKNILETQRGIQLPAVLFNIRELFGRDGIRDTDLDSPDLLRYINKMMRPKGNGYNSSDMNLGRGVGIEPVTYELNDPNRDPFAGLVPKRF